MRHALCVEFLSVLLAALAPWIGVLLPFLLVVILVLRVRSARKR